MARPNLADDAHLLVANSVQFNVVEYAHGDNPVLNIIPSPLARRVSESF